MTQKIVKYSSGELHFFEQFEALKADLPNGAIANIRDEAIAKIKAKGLPTKRVEAYHYTDLRSKFSNQLNFAKASSELSAEALAAHAHVKAFEGKTTGQIVFVDGVLSRELSDVSKLEAKIDLNSMADLVNDGKLPECLTSKLASGGENPVDLISQAMWRDGIVVNLNEDFADDENLHLIFVASVESASVSRHAIKVMEGVSANLVESHINIGDVASFNVHHLDIVMAAKTELNHFIINAENQNSINFTRLNGVYHDEAKLNQTHLALGSSFTRREGDLYCEGEDMELNVGGAVLAGNRQHIDNTYVVHHKLPNNVSMQRFKNVLDGKANAVFQGKVIVSIDAQKTDGQQMAQTILLSDTASINCKPELEIYADDVECAHGATVGALDEEMLFYLRARGIDKLDAQKLLIHAFVGEIYDELDEGLKETSDQLIEAWLEDHLSS